MLPLQCFHGQWTVHRCMICIIGISRGSYADMVMDTDTLCRYSFMNALRNERPWICYVGSICSQPVEHG